VFHYDFSQGITQNTHEWCAEGIAPQIDDLQAVPLRGLDAWVEAHQQGVPYVVDEVYDLPSGALRDILEPQGVLSLITLPLFDGEQCYGFIGFDSLRERRSYSPDAIEVLSLFAQLLVNHQARLRALQASSERDANFRIFFDSLSDFLFILDEQGRILRVNQTVRERLGYTDEQLIGQSVLMVHPPARRQEAADIVQKMLQNQADTCPVPLQARAGQQIPVETRVMPGQWNGAPALFGISHDLTALAASEEKFAKAFHFSPAPMAITRLEDGVFLEVNGAFSQLMGYSPEEVMGKSSRELGIFADRGQREAIVRQVLEQGAVCGFEVQVRNRDGRLLYGLFNASLLQLQHGLVMLTQMLDITDRRSAELALADEHRLLRTLLDASADLIWLKDLEGRYLACNKRFEALYDRAESALLGRRDEELADIEAASVLRQAERAFQATGEGRNGDAWLRFQRDGYRGLFDILHISVQNGLGDPLGVLGTARDVTLRHQSEERLRMTAKVFDHSHDGIMICDAEGQIIEVNPAFSTITGYRSDEVVGRNPRLLSSGQHDAQFYQELWHTVETQGFWRGTLWNRRRDASLFASQITISKVSNKAGRLSHYIGVFTDVTQIRATEKMLEMLAHFDALTTLPNRVLLEERLHRAMSLAQRREHLLAVCYIDLDGFKPVNDSYGHSMGDRLLVGIARPLESAVRGEDTVARLGGDEFVVLLNDISQRDEVEQAAVRIIRGVAERVQLDAYPVQVSASMGIALYPLDSSDADELLQLIGITAVERTNAIFVRQFCLF
ncbi:MAG: PAS domain S-box protein, partial [Gammaproteobacteria bacterium]|nr:PAS domain S-box protein [Gammaproteobacteria bacterium]